MATKAKKRAPKARPYWWFQGASVVELLGRLQAAGPDARLEVRIDASQSMTLHVVAPGPVPTEGGGGVNESHVCPPVCP